MTDIVGTVMFVILLVSIDVGLRIVIECLNYLKYSRKPITATHIASTFLWYGWGDVDGKRFLISKGLRAALISKLGLQYPLMFVFSVWSFLLPSTVIWGWRFDYLISFIFLIIPVICEVTSIIEKLNILNADIVKLGKVILGFVRSIYEKK